MELVEKTELKEPYLCLNMIVKNEGHIIKDTLTKLLNKVPAIDFWVISDTGSTDKTKEIISDFFKERNIDGEIFDDEWKDFGHNRTLALEHAYKKSRFLLVFDADDEICGDFVLPDLKIDSYHLQFGDSNGTSYTRTQIVNNKKKWKYVGVLHEIITCTEHTDGMDIIKGKYYTISGKSGSRSQDQNKYQKDALILEKAYEEAVKNNDGLYNRYGFYCANSYYDCGKYEDAIKWYKITLGNQNWSQEKYVACQRLHNCYNMLNQKEAGMFYLVKSFSYDKERAECLYELVSYYCCNDMNEVAYGYYTIAKSFYNEKYLKDGLNDRLFLDVSKANLFLPYYMILVSDKARDHDTTIQMYRIIFTKKHIERSKHYIGNMLYNLQFFIERVKDDTEFLRLFQEYINFLISINYPVYDHDFMSKYEKYGIVLPKFSEPVFSLDDCLKSKNILLYSGYSPFKWNYTFSINNALGGSETAITCLTKNFPKDYTIYVAGDVEEETVENVRYVHFNNLTNLIKTTAFHTIIVSRYLNFYELYRNFSAYQTFIWGHDITLYAYGTDFSVENILTKWASKITGCICQTEWHKNLFLSSFPQLKDKISTINNGINDDLFISKDITKVRKIANRFIYTSCSERGLYKLVQLWPSILDNLPDAELVISSYNNFPKSEEDNKILEIINKTPSIKHMGKLNRSELYELMALAEYWLYTSYFQETSCITSLELLASEVICLYYPVAGLVNTVGDYGIPISEGNELEPLLSLSIKKKTELKKKGKEYALSCSWKNRATEWCNIILAKEQEQEQEQEQEKNNIKVINLKRREDRKNSMTEQFERENIKPSEYEFIKAVDGAELEETEEIRQLFEDNNFNYKKSVIGCALSHLQIYNSLINDKNNDYYIVLEDDVELSNDFKQKLNEMTTEFVKQDIEHLALALSLANNEGELNGGGEQQLQFFEKDVYKLWNIGFAYIISKKAARKIISFINNSSIKCAIDNPQAYGEVIKYHYPNRFIVKHQNMDVFGSDINTNHNILQFINNTNNKDNLRIAYCDWWYEEYCGGSFDFNNNFITDILRKYGNINSITIVQPHESPDVLLYSIFGNQHTHFPNLRKVFFSGEPFGIRAEAAFNFTFDRNSDKNTRFPLWLGYLNNYLFEECQRRKNGIINVPKRENFCSFIANGEVKTTHRRTIVDKLSKYKKVHCGGKYLNNIDFTVPRGVNCSGKIEHNNKYKFAIAFENEDYPGYVTEKICDIYKSNCVPIYWGTKEVVNDFNPSTFINARDFENFDELVDYIIKVDNDDELYASFFKEPMFSNKWLDAFNDPNKTFYKNLAHCIIGKNTNMYNNYLTSNTSTTSKNNIKVFNIWHNKLFDHCYKNLDNYSLDKITMYDVNQKYSKEYNKERKYDIVSEYKLVHYNSLYQDTNYCQTSCLYHVFKNKLYTSTNYIGFIQYDMELASNFIYDIEEKITKAENDIYFYSLAVANKIEVSYICKPYNNSILEKYNNYFNTSHTYDSIKAHHKADKFICLHTFVIPTKTFINMMTWYCTITDWLHKNYINGLYSESMSEVTEEIFGLFLLLQLIENDNIKLEELKLYHEWPNLHNNTNFINYKDPVHYFSLDKIVDSRFTDKNTCHSYLETYEKLMKDKHLTCKNVLEIGIQHGGSMKLWNDYFVNANIYGIDVDKSPKFLEEYKRVKCLKMGAYSQESIDYFSNQNIAFDFIIDDGPHTIDSMIYFIKNYTQLLNNDGILIVEDVQDISWCDTFKTLVPNGYTYEIFDLRHIKNRWDDILFVIKKNQIITENIKLEINEIVTRPKCNFSVMTIFKNEVMNLKMWIEHYLWQGVEHFYLIDNGSDDNPISILQEYIDKGVVTYYYRPEKHQQVQHYRYIFDNERLKEKTKWLCICDLDEFFFGTEQKLVDAIDLFDNYNVIYTNSFFYGSDNLIEHPKDIRTAILHREADIVNGTKYIFKPDYINDSSEIWIHWLVNPGTLQKKQMNEITQNNKIRLNHYRIQSFEYYSKVKMTRGDVSIMQNENIRDIKYFEHYTEVATIKDDILKQIVENGYDNIKIVNVNTTVNTAVIVEPRLLKHLPFVINDYYKKLGRGWKIVFYCGVGLKNIWIDLLSNNDIEIRELKTNCYKYNEYCDFIKSKELYETLYGDYVLLFTTNSTIINKPPYTIDYYMSLNKSYIGGNQCYLWKEMMRENIYPKICNFHGGLSLRKRLDMIEIIDTFGTEKTLENCGESQSLQTDAEDVYFAIGCYKLWLPIGEDAQSSHFSVHNHLKGEFFGANGLLPGYYLNLIQKYDNFCDNIYLYKNIEDIENETLVVEPGSGFFSNCTLRLFDIILYFNAVKKLPIFVDGTQQFELYKAGTNMNDITYEYFKKDLDYEINYDNPIDFREQYQYTNYNNLNFSQLSPFITKYFSPSDIIKNNIEYIENKYNITNYDDICVLFYRGNDKITETALPSYETIIEKARTLYNENNNIKFLVQSDEIEFIERMTHEFPNRIFYFKDEIRTIKKSDNLSVDKINHASNFVYSQYFLAITIIMSKCKYVVCTRSSCSLWIALFRGNSENVYQL